MNRLLMLYLTVTGVAAFVALSMPGVVVIATLLIIPGLLLMLAPTAFLWGCLFALAWAATKSWLGDTPGAIAAAVGLTALALVAIPAPSRIAGEALYRASLRPDIVPAARIAMRGDIRIDRPRPRWDNANMRGDGGMRGFSCDNLCLALLFTPGVTSVTINNSADFTATDHRDGTGAFDFEARTYRLVPKAGCGDGGLKPDLDGMNGLFPGTPEEGKALDAEWRLKLQDFCLTRTGPIGRHDLLIREGGYGGGARRGEWSLLPSGPLHNYVDIRDATGALLLRRSRTAVSVPSWPLYVGSTGGIENFRFGWGRTTLANKPDYPAVSLLAELEAHSDTVGKVSGADLLPPIRAQLRAALADPAVPADAPAFQLIGAFLDAVDKPLPPEDLALVAALGRDDRITRYDGIWKLKDLPLDQQRAISAALVARAIASTQPLVVANSLAGNFIKAMPPGSFRALSADEARLLALPRQRVGLPALVERLDEGGPRYVSLLISILRDHAATRQALVEEATTRRRGDYAIGQQIGGQRDMMEATRTALCRLGPVASAALGPIEELIGAGTIDAKDMSGHSGADWALTMARLGKPIDTLQKPANLDGTVETFRDNIRRRLDRFDPRRDC